jgi:cytochrome P450
MDTTFSATSSSEFTGPNGHLLFGHLPEFSGDRLEFITRCAREYGDIVALRLGSMKVLLLNHPDLVEEVLVRKNHLFIKDLGVRKSRFLGNGLLASEGEFWLRQRRLAQPAFHRERILQYMRTMIDYTKRWTNSWQNADECDINAEMMQLTLAIATKTLFDVDSVSENNKIGKLINITSEHFRKQSNTGFLIPDWFPTLTNLRFHKALWNLDNYIKSIISAHRNSNHDRGDLLSMFIAAQDHDGSQMTEKQLLDEVRTMFLAGHETTANLLSWTWWLLAQNPEVEAKLKSELQEVIGDREVTPSDLPNLKYCELIITESLRLMPPAWLIAREATQNCEIGGHSIKKGTTVMMSQWVIHHDPRFFAEADKFIPERWANNFAKTLPTYAYFPFGGGQRLCIGKQFALTEAILVLAIISQKFSFRLLPGQKVVPEPSVTLYPKYGIKVKVETTK